MKKILPKAIGLYLNTLARISPEKAGQIGFELFCRPFRSKITTQHKEFFETAARDSFEHRGEQIQIYRWGNGGKTVVFVHGWQSHTYRWKKYIEQLSKENYTIYSLDAPGHGLSSGKFLNLVLYSEVLEKLIREIGPVHAVVSHSIGSFTSLYTFYRNQDFAPKKLIALASPGEVKEFFQFYATELNLSIRSVNLMVSYFTKVIGNHPEFFSAPRFASELTSHGLLIHDEDDDDTSVDHSRAIHHAWKNSTLITTKGMGHNLRSPEVIDHVVKFIQEQQFKIEAAQPPQQ